MFIAGVRRWWHHGLRSSLTPCIIPPQSLTAPCPRVQPGSRSELTPVAGCLGWSGAGSPRAFSALALVVVSSSRCSKWPKNLPVLFLTSTEGLPLEVWFVGDELQYRGVSSSGPDLDLTVPFATYSQGSWSSPTCSCVLLEQCFQLT